jgi:hypothetical protein
MNNPAPHAPQRPRVANSDVRFRAMFPVQMLTRLTAAHGAPPAKSPPYLSFCGHIEQWQTNITGSDPSRSHIAEALPQGHWRRSILGLRAWWPIGSGRRSLALRAPSIKVSGVLKIPHHHRYTLGPLKSTVHLHRTQPCPYLTFSPMQSQSHLLPHPPAQHKYPSHRPRRSIKSSFTKPIKP